MRALARVPASLRACVRASCLCCVLLDCRLQEDLRPADNPEGVMKSLVSKLGASDWAVQMDALNNLRALAVYHASATIIPQLHAVIRAVLLVVDNLRSNLSKSALMSLTDMFKYLKVDVIESRCMHTRARAHTHTHTHTRSHTYTRTDGHSCNPQDGDGPGIGSCRHRLCQKVRRHRGLHCRRGQA